MSDLLQTHIIAVLEANHAVAGRTRRLIEELEGQGHRIISGGQLGESAWDIIDWRTNEILAAGDDGLEGYAAAGDELDPDGTWIHRDRILEDEDLSYVSTPGLPDGLAETIEDWALGEDAEEVAEFIGWTVAKVEEYQAES
ncbi:hypothetical protein [Actinoplanes awajinensis]|uniref:Uncharacterized protein n=1 Tax=Actinoplanes awajinensis subsp. mycoplanecinus TaxID=135947 RepID=A0A101JS57_9ACTN|nr:hypothetical protein [Actinoplanes awajinensis]KUL31984.1 hypothetical protein ADL15_21000 [Actinoplanes awajinensis subsp. mycoplanecinus]